MQAPYQELDRYQKQSPYEVLGVQPDASATEIRDHRTNMQRDIQEAKMDASTRAKELQRIEAAYDLLCKADLRVRIDFFLLDGKLFLKRCESIARTLSKPKTDVEGVIKPRKIRVDHAALLTDLKSFQRELDKVVGFQPRAMEVPEPVQLPEPLAIQFDC